MKRIILLLSGFLLAQDWPAWGGEPASANAGVTNVAGVTGAGPVNWPVHSHHPLLDYKFTNELGAPVSFSDFRGQVIVYTFFFTRCPVPEFCPRLARNFEEASRKLASMTNGTSNFHLLSISFDPDFDTPAVLREYAARYHYDSNHWSFLTGPKEKMGELARMSGVEYQPDQGLFTHNFKTIVIDPRGRMQTSFPMGGDLSDVLTQEIMRTAAATNAEPSQPGGTH